MKSFALVFFSFALLTTVSSLDSALIKRAMADVRTCIKKDNLDPEVAYKIMTADMDDPSHDLKCLLKCLGQLHGGFSKTGRISKKNMMKKALAYAPELIDELSEVWDECALVPKDDDLCEYAYQLAKCAYDRVK